MPCGQVMHDYMATMQTQGGGWWAQDFDLYGDPTISFYGNGGADAVGAPWPMLRNNSAGLGYTSLTGPVQTKLLWSYPATARVLDPLKPSPLVTSSNDVIASYFQLCGRDPRRRAKSAHLTLTAPVFGSPALADDGTIYAVTIGGLLYAFTPTGPGGSYVQRWTLDLGAIPTTSPIIGPDGFVAVGHQRSPERQPGDRPPGRHPVPRHGPGRRRAGGRDRHRPRPHRIYHHHRRRPGRG